MSTNRAGGPLVTQELLDRLRAVVGADEVITGEEALVRYRDPFWPLGDDTYAGAAVVRPGSTEQVQAIVRLANAHDVPVWTLGQGRNNGYGGSSPRLAGSIRISMERLDRVLEINEKLAYAVVEPGVRFFDLYEALRAGGHQLRMAVPDLGWGSVTGNAMDNGIQYMPLASNHGTVAGLEVVLPDGELLRTNMGAVPGSTAWHTYKRSMGPSLDALFTQSNLGIVTRMGVWLQRTPEAYQTLVLGVEKDEDLDKAIDTIRELMLDGTLQGVPSMYPAPRNGALLLDLPVPQPTVWTEEALDAYAAETGIGRWAVRVGLWEDREVLEYKSAKIKRVWSALPGARIKEGRIYRPAEYDSITGQTERVQIGVPTLQLNELTPEHIGHVGFSPVIPLDGAEIKAAITTMRRRATEHGVLLSGAIMAVSPRAAAVVLGLQFDRRDEAAVRTIFSLVHELITEFGAEGYGEYRAHIDTMDDAADQYSFNDHAYRRFVERIKDAVDPQGILSPGRHGIWPARYREARDR